ncbi:MAG: hypothetical protein ACRYG6_04840 [Janthinobacterium lividum]
MAAESTTTLGTHRAVTAPSRRHLISGSILAALTGDAFAGAVVLPDHGEVFPPAPNPDADLLATCAAFDALERAYRATDFDCAPRTPEDLVNDAERSRIATAQNPLVERMAELRAVTRAGQIARARSLALWKPELLNDEPSDFGECLASAIVRDLIGEG